MPYYGVKVRHDIPLHLLKVAHDSFCFLKKTATVVCKLAKFDPGVLHY